MSARSIRVPAELVDAARRVVGENVRRRRIALGLTQAALAEQVGIEPQSLQRIELGSGAPSFTLLVALADVLKIEVGRLFRATRIGKRTVGRPPSRRR